jgi:hypothetical protein
MNSRAKPLPLAALATLAAVLSTACTSTGSTLLPNPHPADVFFIDGRSLDVGKDYLDRYACRTGVPLQCTCTSLHVASTCDCACY